MFFNARISSSRLAAIVRTLDEIYDEPGDEIPSSRVARAVGLYDAAYERHHGEEHEGYEL